MLSFCSLTFLFWLPEKKKSKKAEVPLMFQVLHEEEPTWKQKNVICIVIFVKKLPSIARLFFLNNVIYQIWSQGPSFSPTNSTIWPYPLPVPPQVTCSQPMASWSRATTWRLTRALWPESRIMSRRASTKTPCCCQVCFSSRRTCRLVQSDPGSH